MTLDLEKLDKKGWNQAIKISKAAARLFSRKGYLETTMDQIANSAKFSKGGMYYYFPSKTEVLFFILSNYMDLVLENLEQELGSLNDCNDKLKHIISRHINLYASNSAGAKVLFQDAHCLPTKYFRVIAEKERKYYRVVAEVLQPLFNKPMAKDKITALTFTLFGMCNWIYSWYDPKGSVSPQELSEIIWTIFTKGIFDLTAGPKS